LALPQEGGTVLAMKYAQGNYGNISLQNIRYNIGESITGRALKGEKPLGWNYQVKK
jgi:hypothetical protein